MHKVLILLTLTFTLMFSSACVYRSGIIQGGQVDTRALKKLKTGMTEQEVLVLLGTPLVQDKFHPNRWDYLYYTLNRSNSKQAERISVFFENGVASKIENTRSGLEATEKETVTDLKTGS